MSTTIKRIALVAVAALGFGVLSVVPSQAAVQNLTITVEDGKATLTVQDTTTAASIVVAGLLDGGVLDTITVSVIEKSKPAGTSPVALLGYLETTTLASRVDNKVIFDGTAINKYESVTNTSSPAGVMGITSATAAYVGAKFTLQLESLTGTAAGTYTYTVIAKPYAAGVEGAAVSKDVSIVIAAAAAPKAAVASAATAYIQAKDTVSYWANVVADSVTAGSLVAGTAIGAIQVKNQSAAGVSAVDTITVSMTGVGYLKTTAGPTTAIIGRSFVVTNEDILEMQVIADGSSGTGTITIKTEAGASFVKTVTFFDTKPTTATATVKKAFIKAGTGSVQKVFAVAVTDAAGNAVTNITKLTAVPTDTATTVGGAATCSLTYNTTDKAYYCEVAGLSATKFGPVAYTISATGADAAATVVKTSATVTFADNVATKAVLAGPATGTPGATVEYTLTLTEKNGNPVADDIYGVGNAPGGVLFSATAADSVISGWAAGPFNASDSYTSVSGVITSKAVLPIAGTASQSLTLVGDGLQTLAANAIDKTIGKTKVTVTTDVTNPGVDAATDANEATDAANAATDAALAAAEAADAATTAAQEASDAVAALSETVTKLISDLQAQIKSLAAVVAKIAKKVKA
jgi:hypothetical protein